MSNFHPDLYVWLCKNHATQPKKAKLLQEFLGTLAFTEVGIPYPLTAKYNMCLEGIPTENVSRVRSSDDLTDYARDCVEQMRDLCCEFAKMLEI